METELAVLLNTHNGFGNVDGEFLRATPTKSRGCRWLVQVIRETVNWGEPAGTTRAYFASFTPSVHEVKCTWMFVVHNPSQLGAVNPGKWGSLEGFRHEMRRLPHFSVCDRSQKTRNKRKKQQHQKHQQKQQISHCFLWAIVDVKKTGRELRRL